MAYLLLFVLLGLTAANAPAATLSSPDQGFEDMYNLSFGQAHQQFEGWGKQNPGQPQAPVFDAAAYLFDEFDRLRILQSQFFVDDASFSKRKKEAPSEAAKQKFYMALDHSQKLADERLKQNPDDQGALFANVLRLGLHSNYLALIEKQNLAALGAIKQSTQLAEQLLAQHPDCYDAYIAIGIENYLLSLKPAPVRWFLHAAGAQTDKRIGLEKLRLTATKGHYLKPYAELLLAVAALRDKDNTEARKYLSDLAEHYPNNPLYRQELAKLQ